MSKDEAIEALRQGKKLTHSFFTNDEYVFQPDVNRQEYCFEDGVICSADLFWHDRRGYYWETGWEIKKGV